MGATDFGYRLAYQFNLPVIETAAALVPLTFGDALKDHCASLSGLSVDATVTAKGPRFKEGLLFTHRGLSGPSVLQASSYWQPGDEILVNLASTMNADERLQQANPRQSIVACLAEILPRRLAETLCEELSLTGNVAELSKKKLNALSERINRWRVKPSGSEGYRTAEVTRGGVDTRALNPKTMEARIQPGLYFIGEVVDVTGWLGGYNFQWAWSSGWVAGQSV